MISKILGLTSEHTTIISLLAVASQASSSLMIIFMVNYYLGSEYLGFYALLISFSAIISLGEFGLGQSIIHYGNKYGIDECYCTVQITLIIFLTILIIVAFPFLMPIVYDITVKSLPNQTIYSELSIIIVSTAIGALARVSFSGLNASMSYGASQFIVVVGSAVYLILSFLLIPKLEVLGICIAHLAMTTMMLVMGHIFLKFKTASKSLLLNSGSVFVLKKIYKNGLGIQGITLLVILSEPLVKILIGNASNLIVLGQYEIASKLILGLRDLAVRPLGYLGGHFSRVTANKDVNPKFELEASFKKTIYLSLVFMFLCLLVYWFLLTFFASIINPTFTTMYALLVISWFFNIAVWIICYHFYIGVGKNLVNILSLTITVFFIIVGGLYSSDDALVILYFYGTGIFLCSLYAFNVTKRKYALELDWSNLLLKALRYTIVPFLLLLILFLYRTLQQDNIIINVFAALLLVLISAYYLKKGFMAKEFRSLS